MIEIVARHEQLYSFLRLLHPILLALGLVLFGLRAWFAAGRPRLARASRIGLVVIALVAIASWDGFGRIRYEEGFAAGDVYHYYVGSKYAAELGYFALYDCTVHALREQDLLGEVRIKSFRDLRTLEQRSPRSALRRGRDCPPRFEPERWREFKRDVRFFHDRAPDAWKIVLADAGYHPTPVWSLVGGTLANLVPLEQMAVLLALDRLLLLAVLAGVVWAFGLEAGALLAIAWGTSPLWGYLWMGGAYLRWAWFAAGFLGLCLLRRRRNASAGFLLGLSALLRLFPAVFLGGYAAYAALSLLRRRALPPGAPSLFGGAALSLGLLVPASLFYTGGAEAYAEFIGKMGRFSGAIWLNTVGLAPAANEVALWTAGYFEGRSWSEAPRVFASGSATLLLLRYGLIALFAGLFALALTRARAGWEAAALGFAAIPIVSMPPNYYYAFVLAAALLAPRRPWAGVLLLVAVLGWCATTRILDGDPARFVAGASFVAVLLCFGAVLVFARTPATDAIEGRSGAPRSS